MEAIYGICGVLILVALGLACIMVVRSQVLPLWRDLFHASSGSERGR